MLRKYVLDLDVVAVERFHSLPLNHTELSQKVRELMHDDFVGNRRGVFEYVLSGCQDTKLLNVRLFDKPTMRKVYQQQTDKAKAEGVSNCPLLRYWSRPECPPHLEAGRNRCRPCNRMEQGWLNRY